MWVAAQQLPDDERSAIDRHVPELGRLAEDLALLDREIAHRQFRGQPIDNGDRREFVGRRRHRGGDRRPQPAQ